MPREVTAHQWPKNGYQEQVYESYLIAENCLNCNFKKIYYFNFKNMAYILILVSRDSLKILEEKN